MLDKGCKQEIADKQGKAKKEDAYVTVSVVGRFGLSKYLSTYTKIGNGFFNMADRAAKYGQKTLISGEKDNRTTCDLSKT